jgi:hypothetical protein
MLVVTFKTEKKGIAREVLRTSPLFHETPKLLSFNHVFGMAEPVLYASFSRSIKQLVI